MRTLLVPLLFGTSLLLVSRGPSATALSPQNDAPLPGPTQEAAGEQAPAPAEAEPAVAFEIELLALTASINGELADLAAYTLSPEEVVLAIERVAAELERREEALTATIDGRTFLVRTLFRAAMILSNPAVDARTAAVRLAEKAVGLVDGLSAARPDDRAVMALVGEVYVGRGRIALVRGDLPVAIFELERAAEVLEQADKGRGTGTGGSESTGPGDGDGKGRARGKGKNKGLSLASKRYLTGLYRDLERAYRDSGNSKKELESFQRERLIVGKLCQMEHGSPAPRYEEARYEMALLIDRLGDATRHAGDAADAVKVEVLSLQILREIHEVRPEVQKYLEAMVDQHVEIAMRQADLSQLEELRATMTQAGIELQLLENRGATRAELLGFDARLRLQMGRGLMIAAAAGAPDLRSEAQSWFSAVGELIETIRSENGSVTAQLTRVEADAQRGLAEASAGN